MYAQSIYDTDMNTIYQTQDNYDTYNDSKSRKKFKKSDLLDDTSKIIEPKQLKKQQLLRKTSLNQTNCLTTYDYTEQCGSNNIKLNEPINYNNNNNINNSSIINEKTRLLSINEAFEILRLHIPTFPYERRLSKIDTLHLAISYINLLESVLESNMTLYDYLRLTINQSFGTRVSFQKSNTRKPIWATSDLTVRLNWLNWNALGIKNEEIQSFLNLFQFFGDSKQKCLTF